MSSPWPKIKQFGSFIYFLVFYTSDQYPVKLGGFGSGAGQRGGANIQRTAAGESDECSCGASLCRGPGHLNHSQLP